MFSTEAQLARACQALCEQIGLHDMWTTEGPTERSIALLEANGGPMSTGERIVFLAAWSIWNGSGNVGLGDAVHRLDSKNLRALGTLVLAVSQGSQGVDGWLAEYEGKTGGAPTCVARRARRP